MSHSDIHNSSRPTADFGVVADNQRLIYITSATAVLAAFVMVFIKMAGWYFTQSVAMLGAVLDSLMDGVMSVFIFFSVRYSIQPADKEHRFGHGKAEALTAFVQGIVLIIASGFLFWIAIININREEIIGNNMIGIVASAICIIITLMLIALQNHAVRRTGSLALRADRLHYMMDVGLYILVILALFLTEFFAQPNIDAMFGMGLALYIAFQAISILKDSLMQLMDHELSDPIRDEIKQIACNHHEVSNIHDLRTRMSGQKMIIQFHIEMDGKKTLFDAHNIADDVERAICQKFPSADVIIHQDPVGLEKLTPLEQS